MKFALLLALFLVRGGRGTSVVGHAGQNVTLSCKYDKSYGLLSACWSRGQIPISGCGQQLIATDGHAVKEETRASSRYQLLGRLDEGDVSLTILSVTELDAGHYGCRVAIPGWFNDNKYHFNLSVLTAAEMTTSAATARQTSAASTTTIQTGQLTTLGTVVTSFSSGVKAEENSVLTVVLVCVLFGLIVLGTAGGLIIIARRLGNLSKIPRQAVDNTVHFSSTSSTLQLHSRSMVVENIYQIDEGGDGDGDEYEYCP